MTKEKKTIILDAATKAFSQKGYKKTSVASIAATAGVSIGTLYSYFDTKANLFEAIRHPELKNFNPDDAEKKSAILKVALRLFGENGYDSTTMEAVADSCGFSKAVLYHFFQSKEALFAAIFDEPQFFGMLENMHFSLSGPSLHNILEESGMLFLNLFENSDRLNLLKIVISESGRFPHLGPLMFENTIEKASQKMSEILAEVADRGGISKTDYKLAARAYFGLLYSFVLTNKIMNPYDGEFTNEQIINFAADIFSNGMK